MKRNREPVVFVTLVESADSLRSAKLLVESLRLFGGELCDAPFWIFVAGDTGPAASSLPRSVRLIDMSDAAGSGYPFHSKASACARAELMAEEEGISSMVWMTSTCLIASPPELLDLTDGPAAAFREVHVRNIGSPFEDPPDPFWMHVYSRLGLPEAPFSIVSSVDGALIRPYFNTHLFAVDPRLGLMDGWLDGFDRMIADDAFQKGACSDTLHKIFLHQAVLSTLLVKLVDSGSIRMLPPTYSYPLHFHQRIPPRDRARTLEELACPVYEGSFVYPSTLEGLEVAEPYRSFLSSF